MRGKVWCTPRRASIITVVVSFAAAITTFPEFFESRVRNVRHKNVHLGIGVKTMENRI